MDDATPLQRLASLLIGRPLDEYVAEGRAHGKSWRTLADEIAAATDGLIEPSHESLRQWYGTERAA